MEIFDMTYEGKPLDSVGKMRLPLVPNFSDASWKTWTRRANTQIPSNHHLRGACSPCDLKWAKGRAISICNRLRIAPSLRDDIISESYLAIQRAAHRYEHDRNPNFRAYLNSVIRCAVIDHLRKQQRYYRRHVSLDLPSNIPEQSDSAVDIQELRPNEVKTSELIGTENPESFLLRQESLSKLSNLIKQLPRRERVVVVEHYFNGRTLTEIGNECGYSKSLISSLHRRALIRLKHQFRTAQQQA
jgi:RNA polymerase sigma factor (sigma-70 family)